MLLNLYYKLLLISKYRINWSIVSKQFHRRIESSRDVIYVVGKIEGRTMGLLVTLALMGTQPDFSLLNIILWYLLRRKLKKFDKDGLLFLNIEFWSVVRLVILYWRLWKAIMSTACCRLIDKFDKLLLPSSIYCQPLIVDDLTNLINYCFEKGFSLPKWK